MADLSRNGGPAGDLGPVLLCAGTDPDLARDLARRAAPLLADRRIIVLSAWSTAIDRHRPLEALLDNWLDLKRDLDAQAEMRAQSAVDAARSILEAAGFEITSSVVYASDSAHEVILDAADAEGAAVIVAGNSGRRDDRPGTLGHEIRAVAHRTRVPLLVIPTGQAASDTAPAVFAFDGSPEAQRALAAGAALLRPRPASVAIAYRSVLAAAPSALLAVPAGIAYEGARKLDASIAHDAAATVTRAIEVLETAGWESGPAPLLAYGSPWRALVDHADACDAAVVIAGDRHHSRLAASLLGSVAEALLRHADRPVLLAPA